MNIQFYGHSITNISKEFPIKTFVDLVLEKYQATCQSHSRGIAMCSEERILYDLKKTKDIDVAVIFHTNEDFYFFLPDGRDYNIMDVDELNQKFGDGDYGLKIEKTKDKAADNCGWETFNANDIKKFLTDYQKLMLSKDLMRNRYFGALIQIDQYCTSRGIPVIHCPLDKPSIPNWFKFTSGIVDYELNSYNYKNSGWGTGATNPYYIGYQKSDNAISEDGNILIANRLFEHIDQLLKK
jgi:hypothetical protein